MLTIAHSEFIQIFRDRSALVTSLVMPLAASAFFIYYREGFERIGSLGYITAILVFTIAAFSLYASVVTTLAARRETLFLKRLRSTAASDPHILTGIVLPVSGIALVQVTVMLVAFAVASGGPANIPLLLVGVVATFVMMLALGMGTAGLTSSSERAQITTLPLSLLMIASASWVGITGTESFTVLKQALPGGAAAELIIQSWNGGSALRDSLVLLGPTVAWMGIAVLLASRLFRWEPRR